MCTVIDVILFNLTLTVHVCMHTCTTVHVVYTHIIYTVVRMHITPQSHTHIYYVVFTFLPTLIIIIMDKQRTVQCSATDNGQFTNRLVQILHRPKTHFP